MDLDPVIAANVRTPSKEVLLAARLTRCIHYSSLREQSDIPYAALQLGHGTLF